MTTTTSSEALSLSPETLSLSSEDLARYRDTQMVRMDELMATKMQAFLAGIPTHETSITPLLKVGDRQLIVATAEALGVDCLVIGAHGKRSFLDILLGGTATAVSRHAPCAVVMVQPGEKRPLVQQNGGATAASHHPRGISLMESGKPSVDQVAPLDKGQRGGHYIRTCRCETV